MTRWPAEDSTHETALRERLAAVLLDGAEPQPREVALLALAEGSQLVSRLVPKDRRHEAKARAKEIAETSWGSDATKNAIDNLMAAILVLVIIPTVITT